MISEKQSNVFRYIIPGLLLLLFACLLDPGFVTGNVSGIQDALVLVLVLWVIGFTVDVALLPVIISGFRKVRTRVTKKEVCYDCLRIIDSLRNEALSRISSKQTRDYVTQRITSVAIFDAFVNRNESKPTVGRLFFLFDILHSTSSCVFMTIVGLALPALLIVCGRDVEIPRFSFYYPVVIASMYVFVVTRSKYNKKANNYMCMLVSANLDKLKEFIAGAVAGLTACCPKIESD